MEAGLSFDGPWISKGDFKSVLWLAALVGFVWFVPNTQQWLAAYQPAYEPRRQWPGEDEADAQRALLARRVRWRPTVAWGVAIGGTAAAAFLSLNHVSEFLYFQF